MSKWTWRRRHGLAAAASLSLAMLPVSASAQALPQYLFDVVYHNAPIIVAETYNAFNNVEAADHLLRTDFDCDNLGSNNAANIYNAATICDGGPNTYFSVVETGTTSSTGYFYIGYYFYHPRQPEGTIYVIGGSSIHVASHPHEHDMEGVWFIVKKSPFTPYGVLQAAVTEAHGALIPYIRKDGAAPGITAVQGHYGYVNFWYQPPTGITRPVVIIRAVTHGTYMAQDYTDQSTDVRWIFANGYGIDPNSPQNYGTYRTTVHGDSRAIFYLPMNGGCAPSSGCDRLGPSFREGTAYYGLQEVAVSPVWMQRAAPNVLFTGTLLDIGAGKTGLSNFFPSAGQSVEAAPPWNWLGGRGEYHYNPTTFDNSQWYTFANDMTGGTNSTKWWPRTSPGRLLTNPVGEAGLRFTGLTNVSTSVIYSPYGTATTSPPPVPELSASITKPALRFNNATAEGDYTWTSTVGGGSGGPYTYLWERDIYNNGNYIEVGRNASLTQHLTCWDTGTYVSLRLTVLSPAGQAFADNDDIYIDIQSTCGY